MNTPPSLHMSCRVCGMDAWHLCYECRVPLCARHGQQVLLEVVVEGQLQRLETHSCQECLLLRLRTPGTGRTMILHP